MGSCGVDFVDLFSDIFMHVHSFFPFCVSLAVFRYFMSMSIHMYLLCAYYNFNVIILSLFCFVFFVFLTGYLSRLSLVRVIN